jgi:hypothetical protein
MNNSRLALHILGVVLPIYVARRCVHIDGECRVPDLSREAVLQIQKTRLAYVFYLGTGLTDDSRFEAHSGAGIPTKDGEGASTGTAGSPVLLLRLSKII